ncbi:uncharacterized protein LOC115579653 [Sparus aurata]|uniref:uncharacterized protein LOC115579653 n=1 Tax=Sparus aurata TaxID=8175 RepID=UPI0011C0FEBA|nr:uncharacterized protein LOC115579653 [Sparus aurata]
MEPTTTAALMFLLCLSIQNTGALPVRNDHNHYQHQAFGNEKGGSFVSEGAAAQLRNENLPCQIFPVTDDPSMGVTITNPPLICTDKPHHQTVPPPAPTVNNQGQDPRQKPPPLPPNVFYQPIGPYYILPHNPASGGSHGFGQGGGQLFPQSPFGTPGSVRPPQWFLDLLRKKHLPVSTFPRGNIKPTGNQRGSLSAERPDSTLSKMSSEEDSDSDGD